MDKKKDGKKAKKTNLRPNFDILGLLFTLFRGIFTILVQEPHKYSFAIELVSFRGIMSSFWIFLR